MKKILVTGAAGFLGSHLTDALLAQSAANSVLGVDNLSTGSLANLAHRYVVGFYRRGRSTLFVHPGLGTTGPPIRIGAAPEVTILVLRTG